LVIAPYGLLSFKISRTRGVTLANNSTKGT
jgi:hypothetical protein